LITGSLKLSIQLVYVKYNLLLIIINLASEPCIRAAETCIRKGLLPLKIKGYQIATSLQNPYIALIPKSSLKSGESRRLIGKELIEEAKQFFGREKSGMGEGLITDYSTNTFEVPSPEDIKKAFNTFSYVFESRKGQIAKLEEFGKYCRSVSSGSANYLKKKIHYLSNAPVNDPFFDYLGSIKNRINN
jgi:hypothetical protein